MNNLHISFKKLDLKVNGKFIGFGTSPEADWKIIFISGVVLAVSIKIDKGEIFLVERTTEQEDKALDISALKETVSYYQGKALEFERVKNLKVSIVDPSL